MGSKVGIDIHELMFFLYTNKNVQTCAHSKQNVCWDLLLFCEEFYGLR